MTDAPPPHPALDDAPQDRPEADEAPAPPPPPPVPPAPAAQPGRPRTALAAVTGALAGAAVVGLVWAVTADAGGDEPATFTLNGSFTLTDEVQRDGDGGCAGRYDSGYDDIQEGTDVTVYNAAGDVVAKGELGASEEIATGTCAFDVSVADVPKGETFYKVEVSHRGTVELSAEEAENGELAATLG